MGIGASLRGLDRRVESRLAIRMPKYDMDPPKWLQYSGVFFIIAIGVTGPVARNAAGPAAGYLAPVVLLGTYLVLVLSWRRRHRVRG